MKKIFFMDIDGTLAVGDALIPGTLALLRAIRERDGVCRYFTNNSSKGIGTYIEQFRQWGIPVRPEEFLTAGAYSAQQMKRIVGNQKIFLLGTESYRRECEREGLHVTEQADPDTAAVLIAYDTELNYEKLRQVCALLNRPDIPWYATNPDLCCPSPHGMIPDCGAICQMIGSAVGRTPQYFGKPEPGMILDTLRALNLSKEEAIVIGDRLYTDIASGKNAGVDTCLVLTGEEKEESAAASFCFPSVAELEQAMDKGLL